MLPEIMDHASSSKNRLKSQRVGKPIITALLESWIEKIQDVEDMAGFLKNLSIYNAVGEYLDIYGRLFGQSRNGRQDEEYRIFLLGYIASTNSDASPEGIMEALRVYGRTTQVDLFEHFPNHTIVYMGEGYTTDIYSTLVNIKPAGTSIELHFDDNGNSIVFAEEIVSDFYLTNELDEFYEMEFEEESIGHLSVSYTSGNTTGVDRAILAEEGELTFTPFAEQMNKGVLFATGNIIDDEGDFLVDEDDNNIVYVEYRFKT